MMLIWLERLNQALASSENHFLVKELIAATDDISSRRFPLD